MVEKNIQYKKNTSCFFWWWVDAWMNHDVSTTDSFSTLEEAKKNLCYFDGTKIKEEVVY